ncbi:Plasmodium vivax Vir protein, putative [Plasmodium vivax]|uniref:Vir protein, putative n=1 Tax=Plasmodium vivax TaxID=5855 RepID=A0A1G4HI31_PLAVI|nr:PIR protein [Plasmodium vivax]SCO74586.1 Plasmodium vivax Vir protein, putative [Plasmodium vivax]
MAPGGRSDEYEFFENMDKYSMYKAVIAVRNETALDESTVNKTITDCDSNNFSDAQKKTCKNFNKLTSLLCSIKSSSGSNGLLNNSDYYYLKLWFNLELIRQGAKGNGHLDEFSFSTYKEIDGCFNEAPLKRNFEDIDGDLLKKMKLLDNLYKNYFEIYDVFNSTDKKEVQDCLQYSRKCIEDYKKARQLCSDSSDYFYKALMRFKKTYKKFYFDAIWKDSSNATYVLKIPGDYEIGNLEFYSMEDETFTFILISLFSSVFAVVVILIYIYMFTPIGSRMRARRTSKKKKFRDQDDNSKKSLQYSDDSYNLGSNSRKYNLSYHST